MLLRCRKISRARNLNPFPGELKRGVENRGWRVSVSTMRAQSQLKSHKQIVLGNLASQEFYSFPRICCGSFAERRFAETVISPCKMTKVLRRFAEMMNPHKICAEQYQNPDTWPRATLGGW